MFHFHNGTDTIILYTAYTSANMLSEFADFRVFAENHIQHEIL